MNIPTTALELSKLLGTDPYNLRKGLAAANGQINYNRETDELTPEQLAIWLPRYLQGKGQFKGDKRATVEQLLRQLEANGITIQKPTKELIQHNETQQHKPIEPQPKSNEQPIAARKQKQSIPIQPKEQKPTLLIWLGKPVTRVILMFALASFEFAGTFDLLLHKGFWLALPVALAMSFALLVFTATENRAGQVFCIAFALVLGAIYFEILPRIYADYVFAFVPPIVTAIIVNSFSKK